tara:strand:+ start:7045 stop:8391 length:1347 start_codon:yes stop_codon:yes gene_type:complete
MDSVLKQATYNVGKMLFEIYKGVPDSKKKWRFLSSCDCITIDIVHENLDCPWHWKVISESKNITDEYIDQHPEMKWNIDFLVLNPNITDDFIDRNSDKINVWTWDTIFGSRKFTINLFNKYSKFLDLDLYSVSSNENLDYMIVDELIHLNWEWDCLSVYLKNVEILITKYPEKPWDWRALSYNKSLSLKFIENNLQMFWDWRGLSGNPVITIEFVERYPEHPWNKLGLIDNPNLTVEYVNKNFKIEDFKDNYFREIDDCWEGYYLCDAIDITRFDYLHLYEWEKYALGNNNVTIEFLNKHRDREHYWNWGILSRNPNVTIEFVKENLDKPWNWNSLSSNKNIKMEDIENNLDFPWEWENIILNENLTFEFLEKYKHRIYDGLTFMYPMILNREISERIDNEYNRLCFERHKNMMINVFCELEEILLNPENMSMSKNLGVYSDISANWT